ncbi:MAG TPA: hypothetical protein VHR35_15660 [Nocardioides sp.]|jgi:hypothetical protein|nr:hypothetical protein [Nocardioides sp.]
MTEQVEKVQGLARFRVRPTVRVAVGVVVVYAAVFAGIAASSGID